MTGFFGFVWEKQMNDDLNVGRRKSSLPIQNRRFRPKWSCHWGS